MIRALPTIPLIAWRAAQLGFTALLLLLLWQAADGAEVLRILSNAKPIWICLAVVILISQTVLSALRWKITAAQLGQMLPLPQAIREYFMSQVINQALPGAVVGDAARAVRARGQAGLAVSGQAVVFERLAGQVAMFVNMVCAFGLTLAIDGGLDWPAAYAAPIGTAALVGTAIMGVVIAAQWMPALVGPKLSGWMRPFYTALLARQVLPTQIGLGAAITLCNLAAFGVCAWAVGVTLPLAAIFAIVPVILFSMLIPFTVSGWGVREGAAAVLLPLVGTTPSEAIAVSIMFGCALLLSVLPGLIAVGAK